MATRGGNRTIPGPEYLWDSYLEYKESCNGKTVLMTAFSQKEGKFVTQEVPHPVTATKKGFCAFLGMTEQNFYAVYKNDPEFELVIARIDLDCEIDAREKFENGTLDSRLAGLWMSHYGYTQKTDTEVTSKSSVTIVDDFGDGDEA